jgi:ATP-dependent DNA helicase RecQ
MSQGKVQVIQVDDCNCQAQAVLAEIRRLRDMGVTNWASIAVLSREHGDLAQVRTLAERESIPVRWIAARSATPPLHQIREIRSFLDQLDKSRSSFMRASDLSRMAAEMFPEEANPWISFLRRLVQVWREESGDAELPAQEAIEFLYEACAESRREFTYGEGVTLSTVHSAKGTEFDHVLLVGPWRLPAERVKQEEERRAFYVGLTRARKTLAVLERGDVRPSLPETLIGTAIIRRRFSGAMRGGELTCFSYEVLSLEDIHLGYPGRFGQDHPIHLALAALQPGDKLCLARDKSGNLELRNAAGTPVARLSKRAQEEWSSRLNAIKEVRFLAAVRRTAAQDADPTRREALQVQSWEIPLVEIVYEQPQ